MLQTEYIRNLNCNYERILLEQMPEEKKYQYCIVTRGGIRGLLPCSLRYINDQAYLYYDISSTQSVAQLFLRKSIDRQWVRDFLWWMKRIRVELSRFLLEDVNLLWYPEQIFQDLEKNDFYFIYIPYYQGENGMEQLLDFLAEHIDYEDEALVEAIYRMHEQYLRLGSVYLEEKIFEDAVALEQSPPKETREIPEAQMGSAEREDTEPEKRLDNANPEGTQPVAESVQPIEPENRRGIRYFLDGRRKRTKEERGGLQDQWNPSMSLYAVSEEGHYRASVKAPEKAREQVIGEEETYGRTVYMEEVKEEQKEASLYDENGRVVCVLDRQTVVLGKRKEEADCVLEHASVSRMHARLTREKEDWYVEDLNSTNGTWKNGIRLQPYEKRRLTKEDELRLGKVILFYR